MTNKPTRKKYATVVPGIGTLKPSARRTPAVLKRPAVKIPTGIDLTTTGLLQRCEHCARFFFGHAESRFCSPKCERAGAEPGLLPRVERFRADRQAIHKSLALALVEGWELFWEVGPYALALRAVTDGSISRPVRTRKVFECSDVASAVRVLAALGDRLLARELYKILFVSKSWRIREEAARSLRALAGLATSH